MRWDPAWFAERELEERRELSLPPASRLAVLTGARPPLEAATAELDLPATASLLGPLPHGVTDRWRTLVTVARPDGPALARELARDARPGLGPQGPRPGVGAGRPTGPHDVTASHLRHLDSRA